MSDTPRTDGMEPYGPPYNETPVIHVPKAFARQLERELRDTQAQLGAAQYELDVWQQCAELLAKHVQGVSDEDCKALAVFEKLKGATK